MACILLWVPNHEGLRPGEEESEGNNGDEDDGYLLEEI